MLLNWHIDCFAKVCSLYMLIILAPTCSERLSNSMHQILEGYVGHLDSPLPPQGVEATISICNVGWSSALAIFLMKELAQNQVLSIRYAIFASPFLIFRDCELLKHLIIVD